jgi:hypothetical protein
MEQSLSDQLRHHLAGITKEQFALEWAQIKSLNLGGPSVNDFLCSWNSVKANAFIKYQREKNRINIAIPKKLTPDYRSLSFFSNLAA